MGDPAPPDSQPIGAQPLAAAHDLAAAQELEGAHDLAGAHEPDLDLDLLASSLQAEGGDVRTLLGALVTRLSGALGERLRVERAGRRRKGEAIRQLSIALGDNEFGAALEHGALECTVSRSSGGIRIRSSRVGMDEWLRRLLGALRDEAATTQATRIALEAIVIGDDS